MPLDSNRNYVPPRVSGYFPLDLFNFGAGLPQRQGVVPAQARFSARVIDHVEGEGDIIHWKWIIDDFRGGLNVTVGEIENDFDRVTSSTADTRYYRTLILPQLTTAATTPDPGGTIVGIHHCNIFNTLMLGVGSTTDSALFSETSTTNPVIAAVTYTPTSSITGMAPVVIGGASAATRLLITRRTDPPQIISSATGTVAGTMHTNLDNSWGAIQTFVNDNQILIMAGNTLYGLAQSAAISDAPTALLTTLPAGGYALGMAKLSGAPIRPYWVWPKETTTAGMLGSTETPGRVVSTNQEGTDYQEIPMGLKHVYFACIVNDSAIVATDRFRITYYDGRTAPRDLNWIADRSSNSDRYYECRGLFSNGAEIWAEVTSRASTSATAGTNTQRWWEVYDLQNNSWHQVSATQTLSTTGVMGTPAGGALPLSQATRFTHVYSDVSWRRIFVPEYGYTPFTLYRNSGSAAGTGTGNEFEASATVTLPQLELPGMEGWPKIVSRISFLGSMDEGGTAATAATCTVTAGNMAATFATGFTGRSQLVNVEDTGDTFYRLETTITFARTTDSTRFTPNILPIVIEGYGFVKDLEPPYSFAEG